MIVAADAVLRPLLRALDRAPALAVALRLARARWLESGEASFRERTLAGADEAFLSLSAAAREERLDALARDAGLALPRDGERLPRLATLAGQDAADATVRYFGSFGGRFGESLREGTAASAVRAAATAGVLGEAIRLVLGLELAGAPDDGVALARAERTLLDAVRGGSDDPAILAVWSRYRGEDDASLASGSGSGREVEVVADYDRRIAWAKERNGIPIVHALRIRNRGSTPLVAASLRLQFGPDLGPAVILDVGPLAAGESRELGVPDLRLDDAKLRDRREADRGALHVELTDGPAIVLRTSFPLEILPFDHFDAALPELLAAFVLPNADATGRMVQALRNFLGATLGDDALLGYQARSRRRAEAVVDGTFAALSTFGLGYAEAKAGFERDGQRVRFGAEIFAEGLGNCLDLALLAAATLEAAGLNPLVVLVEGHAFPGAWLVDDWMPSPTSDDFELVSKLVQAGEIVVFDTTLATARPGAPIERAKAAALAELAKRERFRTVVDVRAARLAKIRPLAVGIRAAAAGTPGAAPSAAGRTPAENAPGGIAERRVDSPSGSSGTPSTLSDRLERWKEKLLDLSSRNRLLNFKPSRTLSVAFDAKELAEIEDRLAGGEELRCEPRVATDHADPRSAALQKSRGADETLDAERRRLLSEGRLLTHHDREDLDQRLVTIFRQARTELEETGASTLTLALGFLEWPEVDARSKRRVAPLLLVPVEILRASARTGFRLRQRDDEVRVNETLIERLRLDHGLDLRELKTLPEDDSGIDVAALLLGFRRAVARADGFAVRDEAQLAFFSFAKALLWRDLDAHAEALARQPLVRHLLGLETDAHPANGTPPAPAAQGFVVGAGGDAPEPARAATEERRLVLDADSSQEAAISAAVLGQDFILQGPPGTGKSQTIANIIAEFVARGRRVLFVAEKRAALEVVARRLERAGVGDVCLELHSNKAVKREVVLELARVLESPRPPRNHEHARLDGRVRAHAARLEAHARALHDLLPCGLRVFDALARLPALEDVPAVSLGLSDLLATSAAELEAKRDAAAALDLAGLPLRAIAGHPLIGTRGATWTERSAKAAAGALEALRDAASGLDAALGGAGALLGLDAASTRPLGGELRDLLVVLGKDPPPGLARLAARDDLAAALARLEADAALAEAIAGLRTRLAERWNPDLLLTLELPALRAAFAANRDRAALLRFFTLRSERKSLARAAVGELPAVEQIIEDLDSARGLQTRITELEAESAFLEACLGAAARGARTDATLLRREIDAARRFDAARSALTRGLGRPIIVPPVDPTRAAEVALGLERALAATRSALQAVIEVLELEPEAGFGPAARNLDPERLRENAAAMAGALRDLRAFCRFNLAAKRAEAVGLAPIVRALRDGRVVPGAAAQSFERAFLKELLAAAEDAVPELRHADGRELDDLVQRFRNDDTALVRSGGAAVLGLAAEARPSLGPATPGRSEVGLLLREAKKKRGHFPLRRLLAEIPTLFPRLKPCVLMSPLSIAQYLPVQGEPFDLVIFDEASQISTHDAIGAIARGRQVVVVGDSRQLPPTSFFARGESDDELPEGSVHELESVLDECAAAGVASRLLRWHYRSRDERLIAFSNRHYYEDALVTFPAAADDGTGVELVRHEGRFDHGGTRTNRAEAEALVQWIVDHLRDPARADRSLGVVSFNQPQQMLIEDLLDEARRSHPEIEPFFGDGAAEPVFVKNLENVQGDERDVMLFSITFGPDAAGKVSLNFGALSQSGGERRLNVAVTRARERLVVFAALRPEHIDLSRTRSTGAEHLKAFLRYAECGPTTLAPRSAGAERRAEPTPLVRDIAGTIATLGFEAAVDVGWSEPRIDLAVRSRASRSAPAPADEPTGPPSSGPASRAEPTPAPTGTLAPDFPPTPSPAATPTTAPGGDQEEPRQILAIEIDGPSWRSLPTVRDRERLRPRVLEGLGWRLLRLWSLDWRHDREAEVARLEGALREASTSPPTTRPRGANADLLRLLAGGSPPPWPAERNRSADRPSASAPAPGGVESVRSGIPAPSAADRTGPVGGDARAATNAGTVTIGSGEARDGSSSPPAANGTPADGAAAIPSSLGAGSRVAERADGLPAYRSYPWQRLGSRIDFDEARSDALILSTIAAVVAAEGPVHRDIVVRHVARSFEIGRLGRVVEQRIDALLARATEDGLVRPRGEFFWSPTAEPGDFDSPRGPDEHGVARQLEHLPPEEVAVAAFRVLAGAVALPLSELVRATGTLFGFARTTPRLTAAVTAAVGLLAESGRCAVVDDVVRAMV